MQMKRRMFTNGALLQLIIVLEAVLAIPVTVYYEALCSDSVHFITRELYPNYQYFKDHLTIDFVPYGKALHSFNTTTGKYTFSCQHGREECKGNKLQACGLAQINDQKTKLDFITCIMSSENPSNIYFVEGCTKRYNLDFPKLLSCAVSTAGDELLASHGNKTWNLEPNIYYVPTVVFNDSIVINADDQEKSVADFKAIMCKKILINKPDICNDIGILDKIKNIFS